MKVRHDQAMTVNYFNYFLCTVLEYYAIYHMLLTMATFVFVI
jgi:hypothetical protein